MAYRTVLPAITILTALVCGGAAGCAGDDDLTLPLERTSQLRELQFLTTPRVRQMTREQYIAREQEDAKSEDGQTTAKLVQATMGRLGFFPPTYDMLRGTTASASNVGAFYSASSDTITVFQSPREEVLVHELVHALQDQHFDLEAYDAAALSNDEFLAQRALVEGDATLAEIRAGAPSDVTWSRLGAATKLSELEKWSDEILQSAPDTPAYFSAYPSFAYPYGTAYVSRVVGLQGPSPKLVLHEVDDLFRRKAPESTQEVLRGGQDVDPIVPVGLDGLPAAVADRFDVAYVDRLGEWYIRLLMRPLGSFKSAPAWDGDQLAFLAPRGTTLPSALVWTSAWDDEASAKEFATALIALHKGTAAPEKGADIYVSATDGESFLVDMRDSRVVFVKNLEPIDMMWLAHAALKTKATPLAIHRLEKIHVVDRTPTRRWPWN